MQFHVLSFEGPDRYAQAGGIASRVSGLSESLAQGAKRRRAPSLVPVDQPPPSALRSSARLTAEQYVWPEIIERTLLPRVSLTDP